IWHGARMHFQTPQLTAEGLDTAALACLALPQGHEEAGRLCAWVAAELEGFPPRRLPSLSRTHVCRALARYGRVQEATHTASQAGPAELGPVVSEIVAQLVREGRTGSAMDLISSSAEEIRPLLVVRLSCEVLTSAEGTSGLDVCRLKALAFSS